MPCGTEGPAGTVDWSVLDCSSVGTSFSPLVFFLVPVCSFQVCCLNMNVCARGGVMTGKKYVPKMVLIELHIYSIEIFRVWLAKGVGGSSEWLPHLDILWRILEIRNDNNTHFHHNFHVAIVKPLQYEIWNCRQQSRIGIHWALVADEWVPLTWHFGPSTSEPCFTASPKLDVRVHPHNPKEQRFIVNCISRMWYYLT